jgi:hydroxyacylglutathione hydrolase
VLHIHTFTFGPFQENTYILSNEKKKAIIIDPGMYEIAEFDRFFKYIETEKLQPTLLVNTHTHLDHIFGNAAVKHKFKTPFTFHALDRPVFDGAKQAGAMYGLEFVTSPEPDYYIDENKMLPFEEDNFQILFTPGHSPGSICLYNKEQQFVISGDVLFQMSIGRSDLPGGNHETLLQSIHSQLFALPDEVKVYSGHGPMTTIGFERMNNPFVGMNR